MKYSFMSFSCPSLTFEEMLEVAKRFGYDGVEPRAGSGHKHGIEKDMDVKDREIVRRIVEESPVKISCIATSCIYADPSKVEENINQTLQYIDLSSGVSSPGIRVFGGVIPEGISREKAIENVAESLKKVVDYAADKNVKIYLETHDDWSNPEYVAELMRKVNHPSLKVNWDVMHPVLRAGKSVEDSFAILKEWIGHIHFHDGVLISKSKNEYRVELKPVGKGDVDHKKVLELLEGISYQGYLSGEWIRWEPYEIHLPREIKKMKGYERSFKNE